MKRIERKTLVAVIIIVVLFTSWTDLEKYIEEYLKGFEEFLKYV